MSAAAPKTQCTIRDAARGESLHATVCDRFSPPPRRPGSARRCEIRAAARTARTAARNVLPVGVRA
jgi:hypothetical protein